MSLRLLIFRVAHALVARWTAKHPVGDPDLHHYVGELLYKGTATLHIGGPLTDECCLCGAEGAYDVAEPHLLASGKRDSARLLAQMFVDWCAADGIPGNFALRGTLPLVPFTLERITQS